MYENIYGLSCVENHILAILRSRGDDVSPLYHNCAMPLIELFRFAVVSDRKQEHFDGIPRIQETLKKLKAITLVLQRQPDVQSVRNETRSCEENEYILMKVTPEFTKEMLLARGLRDDHYVFVKSIGSSFAIQNDLPERALVLTENQLTKAYGGDYLKLTVHRELTKDDKDFLFDSRIYKPENYLPFYFYEKDIAGVLEPGGKLRNMTGVYKMLRYRLAAYYNAYVDVKFIDDVLPQIEKYYALFEYYNLRKNVPASKYFSMLCEMNKLEVAMMMKLKNRLENSVYDQFYDEIYK